MAITRRETKLCSSFDVEWRLPDRSKRRKSFMTERGARVFEEAVVTKSVSGDVVDPRAGRITLATVYNSWLTSRLDLSPKVRRGYEDIWRLRIEPRFAGWSVGKIDHQSIQKWVNEMAQSGLSPRTLRWNHSVLKMCAWTTRPTKVSSSAEIRPPARSFHHCARVRTHTSRLPR